MLEGILAMPSQKLGMPAFVDTCRHDSSSGLVDKALEAIAIVCMTRNENLKIVRQADKATIEHPVDSSGKRNTV